MIQNDAMVINSLVPSLSFSPVCEGHVRTGWVESHKALGKGTQALEW